MTDYYMLLGINANSTPADIKAAFRQCARENHPDHHPHDPEAEARFKAVNEAYSVLGNAKKRAIYDRTLGNYTSDFIVHYAPGLEELDAHFTIMKKNLRKEFDKNQRLLDGGYSFKDHALRGWILPMFVATTVPVAKAYVDHNGLENILISLLSSIVNVSPYAALGAVAGTLIDRFRENRRDTTLRPTRQLLSGKSFHQRIYKPLTAGAMTLGLIGCGAAYTFPWWKTASVVSRPATAASSPAVTIMPR